MVETHGRFGMKGGGWLQNKNLVELEVTCGSAYCILCIVFLKERFIKQILGQSSETYVYGQTEVQFGASSGNTKGNSCFLNCRSNFRKISSLSGVWVPRFGKVSAHSFPSVWFSNH